MSFVGQAEEVSKSLSLMKATMFAAGESEGAKEAAVVTAYEVHLGRKLHCAARLRDGEPP